MNEKWDQPVEKGNRKKVTELLKERNFTVSTWEPEDIAVLLEELEVLQIEIESQNKQLQQAHHELQHANARYVRMYDNAPLACFTVDQRSDAIIETNLPSCRFLQTTRDELLKNKFTRYIDPDFVDTYLLCHNLTIENNEPEDCDLKMLRKDGSTFWVELHLTALEDQNQVRIAAFDISRRKGFEEELARLGELRQRIFDHIPLMLVMYNPQHDRFTLNKYTEQLLGWTTEQANQGDLFKNNFPDLSEGTWGVFNTQLLEPAWRETRVLSRDGTQIPLDWASTRLNDDTVIWVGLDLRQHKKAEEQIRWLLEERSHLLNQVQTNFQALVHAMVEGVLVIDGDHKIIFANEAARHILSLSEDQLSDYHFRIPDSEGITEMSLRGKDQGKILELNSTKIEWNDNEAYLITMRDITARKRAMKRIRTLSRRLIDVQEKERREIGRELHDEVGGALTAMKLSLARTAKLCSGDIRKEILAMTSQLDETMDIVSSVSHNIQSDILERFGLIEAVKWFLEKYKRQTGIRVRFTHRGIESGFEKTIEVTAYRIIVESLTNVARYSGVKLASLSMNKKKDVLLLRIEDKGRGFNAKEVCISSSGIGGMQDRVALVGGELTVDSSVKMGTLVTCQIPVEPDSHPGCQPSPLPMTSHRGRTG